MPSMGFRPSLLHVAETYNKLFMMVIIKSRLFCVHVPHAFDGMMNSTRVIEMVCFRKKTLL